MKFPETLDEEDMELAIKEWRLAGYHVTADFETPLQHLDMVYVREDPTHHHFVVRYFYVKPKKVWQEFPWGAALSMGGR